MPKHKSSMIARWFLLVFAASVPTAAVFAADDDTSSPAGVSVPDSPGARELMDKARDKEFQKQWKTAAEFYLDALNKYSGRVVSVARDTDKGIYQYSGIAPIVQERISKWPAEGLTVYRNLYGPTAADLLASAGRADLARLRNIFWTYFPTDAGKTAGTRLLDAYLESGDFTAAVWIGNRLLSLHPNLVGDRAMITYRTALACHWAGDADQAQSLLKDLKTQSPNDIGTIGGKDVSLVDALTTALAAPVPQPTTRPGDADTYPSFGGLGGRGDISTSRARVGASLNSVILTPPLWSGLIPSQRAALANTDQLTLNNNLAMGIMPVVDDGALFFQDGRCVYAVDADSGAPLPGWLNTYGGERLGRYKMNVFGRARNELLTLTVSPATVLAVMGQPDRGALMGGFPIQQPQASTVKLVCLDRDTGREIWTKTPADLPESAGAIRQGHYTGTPLLIPAIQAGTPTDSVLVVARGSQENQFDDCYAICLDQKTGAYRWSAYVGSATRTIDVEGMLAEDPSAMALAEGRVFVMTNLGVVAALDPADGRMLWVNSYNRDGSESAEMMMMRGRVRFGGGFGGGGFGGGNFGGGFANPAGQNANSAKVWAHNPVFVSGGNVFALPRDARQLFVYDAGSGEEKKRLLMSDCDSSNIPSVLLGVQGKKLCVCNEKGLWAIDWTKYHEGGMRSASVWARPDISTVLSTDGKDIKESDICGRGFLTANSVFLPTQHRLIQMSWSDGRIRSFYPSSGDFSGNQGPGNMLVTSQNVVVAGQTRVDVYTDLSLIRQKYETAMAAAPNDPLPRIQYAEALFSGGQTQAAIQLTDEAIHLIGGPDSMRSGKDRVMIFDAMLAFAGRSDRNAESSDVAGAFFDRAAAAADSPEQNASYRLARAGFDHDQKDYAGEVKLCQQVLSDAPMRDASLPGDANAGTTAESRIDTAIKSDASAYEPIEQQAAAALRDARVDHEPARLLSVASEFPNSKAAVEARQDAVHLFEADNQPDQAISVLRRMYLGANDSDARAQILESIANDFLAMKEGVGPAIDRLAKAARTTPNANVSQPLRLPDGTTLSNISYVDALAKLRNLQADAESAALPDFHIPPHPRRGGKFPFGPAAPVVIDNVVAVVHPLPEFNRVDQILTWSPAGLSMFAAGATTPSFTTAAINEPPVAAAWAQGSWLVWTPTRLYSVSAEGKVAWSFAVDRLPSLAVSPGGDEIVDDTPSGAAEDPNAPVNLRVVNGQVMRLQGGVIVGRRAMRIIPGAMANVANVVVPPSPPPVPLEQQGQEQIVAVQPGGPAAQQVLITTSTGRLIGLTARNGQLIWQSRLTDHPVDQLLTNAHFTIIRMDDPSGSKIAVFDTPTGHLIGKRKFGADQAPNQLVNIALSEEATLAITLYGQVEVKDLYDPWANKPQDLRSQANPDPAPYVGMNQPDQLLARGGRLICLYDTGRWARCWDLSNNADPTPPLSTGASSMEVSMQLAGARLFICSGSELHEYNLLDAGDHYSLQAKLLDTPARLRSMMVGKDHVIVINDPVDRGPAGSPYTRLVTVTRATIPGKTREQGSIDWIEAEPPPPQLTSIGIIDWLPSEGGLCFLTKDSKLHLLRGARS